jgi:hypothetical protein
LSLYNKFSEFFYEGFKDENIERHRIGYKDSFLSAMRLKSAASQRKGTILIHGGFDSFIEEFYCFWKYFSECGFEVIAFDGPGQGATHRLFKLAHEHDWENPVKAVLDYFLLTDVTLLGISFGGYWCLRAAAYEKRIKRVISDPPLFDLLEGVNPIFRKILNAMIKSEKMFNNNIRFRMKLIPVINHIVNHCLYINNKIGSEPLVAANWLLAMNKEHLHSELINQDVLLHASENDNFQSVKLYYKQMDALKNAKSITGRIFTDKEQAGNHAQMGNLSLALEAMVKWIEEKS